MAKRLLEHWKNTGDDPFEVMYDHAPVMMHSIDREGRLLRVSRFWAESLGYAPEEMVGRKSVDFLTDKSRRKAVEEVLPSFIKTGRCHNVRYDFIRKSGEILPVLLSATAIFDEDGQMSRSLAVMFDNSEAEAARRALEDKAREVEEASMAKSRFLASMSHEIRTPMNAVLGFASLLKQSDLPLRQIRQVEAILSAGDNLMKLLTDLLDLSRVESGEMRIEVDTIDLHDLLNDVRDWWYSVAREKGLNFYLVISPSVPRRIVTDPGRVRQILNNYLSNAIKFTKAGAVTLSVDLLESADKGSAISFKVTDTGPGIDQEQQDKLFKPFVRADTDFAKSNGGWGLGLSICSQITSLMGGQVGIESQIGRGSVYQFTVPVALCEERPAAAPAATVAEEDATGLRILVAEDNLNQDLIRDMLTVIGHRPTIVDNGFEAVQAILADDYDVVLMDITMPGLDGVGATEQIRNLPPPKQEVPIIAVTANAGSDARERYMAMGMNDYVAKPIIMNELRTALAAYAETPEAGASSAG